MTKASAASKTTPIRIVPLFKPGQVALEKAASPQLTYRGGPLLQSVEVFTIFWGSAWKEAEMLALSGQLNAFFEFIVTSPLLDAMGEYDVPGKVIGRGSFIGSLTSSAPAPRATTTDASIRRFLEQRIADNAAPAPTADRLYFIYLPPGVTVTDGQDASCKVFCGYHNSIREGLYYAVMPYPECSGCRGGRPIFEALTATSSHELCEAITDPVPGQGWYDDTNGEIGDICPWKFKQIGAYTVQLEWSNRANACV